MASDFKLFWTAEAIQNLEAILAYLANRWTEKEINHFKIILGKQIELIEHNPYLFPVSEYNNRLRKAVLSRQTTVFYEVSGKVIYIVFLFNTNQDINKIT
ncbi:MAG: type II toxin-antitoxin system RelE/ParE family toxin [Bacteroidales bacterium]